MTPALIIPLKNAAELPAAGGKAQSLSAMIQNGFQCPDGFVIIGYKADKNLDAQILNYFDKLGSPFVAVRSSAVGEDATDATWAGQYDTFLNVDRQHLLKRIQECYDSGSTDRANAYAYQRQLPNGPIAVLVQKMVQSDISGVAFTMGPITKDTSHVIIEAAFGLGEAVVSGEITPDTYIVDKTTGSILKKQPSHQTKKLVQGEGGTSQWQDLGREGSAQKLSDEAIKKLARSVTNLEKWCGYPVDAEWGYKDEKLYFLQSRPITA